MTPWSIQPYPHSLSCSKLHMPTVEKHLMLNKGCPLNRKECSFFLKSYLLIGASTIFILGLAALSHPLSMQWTGCLSFLMTLCFRVPFWLRGDTGVDTMVHLWVNLRCTNSGVGLFEDRSSYSQTTADIFSKLDWLTGLHWLYLLPYIWLQLWTHPQGTQQQQHVNTSHGQISN